MNIGDIVPIMVALIVVYIGIHPIVAAISRVWHEAKMDVIIKYVAMAEQKGVNYVINFKL